MEWITLAVLSIDLVVIFTHILALVLLFTVKQNNVQGSQKILLIALCMTELTFAVVNFSEELCCIVKLQKAANALYIFLFASVSTMCILIMFLITVDRFLVIYLNIKYDILWSPKKAMIVLSVLLIVCSLLLAPSYVIGLKKVERIGSLYIIPIFEAIFIISASATSFYIFCFLFIFYIFFQASFTKQKKYEAAVTAAESKYQNFLSRRTSQPIQNTCTNNDYSHFFWCKYCFLSCAI